nr:endolytic transglycosylase MltG [Streptomyces sp. TLI_235]
MQQVQQAQMPQAQMPQQQGWRQQAPQQQGGYGQQQYQQQAGQQTGSWQIPPNLQQQNLQQQAPVQQGYPQQQVRGQMPQGQVPPGQVPGQLPPQARAQQGFPQQAGQQPMGRRPMGQQQFGPQSGRPPQPGAPVPPPRGGGPRPSGPGPDGIDWEAEAAALDNPAESDVEEWEEDLDEFAAEEDADDEGSFFGAEEDTSREAERKRKEKGKKAGRRNRGACLVVALVLLGGMAGAGWWGYGFYQDHFGPPPDYTGAGTGSVTVEVKAGAGGSVIGASLFKADVVKSTDAFVAACQKNPKCGIIQPGFYTMHRQMSGAEAVKYMVESAGGNVLDLPQGMKSVDVYTMIDTKLKLPKGSTAKIAQDELKNLGLPAYAQGNIEGFLFPTRYSIAEGMKPADLLKQMVANANQQYTDLDLENSAKKIGLKSGYEVLIEASILQAEGNKPEDFGKMARAISNRLTTNVTQHKLGLDTTLQYQLGRKELTSKEIHDGSLKYNTYVNPGLPPTPISNPGLEAIQAVLNPTPGDWVFWLAISADETKFAATGEEHAKNTEAWCISRNMKFDKATVTCK